MARDNEKYGVSLGPYKAIEGIKLPISLFNTGLNVADGPMDIGETECVDLSNVRTERSGIGPDYRFDKFGELVE